MYFRTFISLIKELISLYWARSDSIPLRYRTWPRFSGQILYLTGQILYLVDQILYLTGQILYFVGQILYLTGQILYLVGQILYLTGQIPYLVGQIPYLVGQILYLTGQILYLTGQILYLVGQILYLTGRIPYIVFFSRYRIWPIFSGQILYLKIRGIESGPYSYTVLQFQTCYFSYVALPLASFTAKM